jgi:hypothetical protein
VAAREADHPARPVGPPDAPYDPRLGTTVAGRYKLVSRLGAGGMGTVYEAEQLSTRRRVAVKILSSGLGRIDMIRKRFEREALAASRLQHPNIVAVVDYGTLEDGGLFLAMERVRGVSLGDLLEAGRLPGQRVLVIARQILEALRHAHASGVVHRDLKPDNVMVEDTGERGPERDRVKLLDFGIAKLIGDAELEHGHDKLTQAGVAFGTPEYMSPEQAMGEPVDGRADLYAMGVMLFEMLSGRRPFDHPEKLALLKLQVAALPPTLLQAAPDAISTPLFEALVAKALAKRREERFQNADEMLVAFDAAAVDWLQPLEVGEALEEPSISTTTLVTERRARAKARATEVAMPSPLRTRRVRLAVAAGLTAVVAVGAVLWLGGDERVVGRDGLAQAHLLSARARGAVGDLAGCFGAYQAAVETDQTLMQDPWVRGDVTALASRARDGVVRGRARMAAQAWGFGDDVDWMESYTLDLQYGETCAERREAVPRLRALKDKRAVPELKRARARDGNSCLERDAREAILFLEALP